MRWPWRPTAGKTRIFYHRSAAVAWLGSAPDYIGGRQPLVQNAQSLADLSQVISAVNDDRQCAAQAVLIIPRVQASQCFEDLLIRLAQTVLISQPLSQETSRVVRQISPQSTCTAWWVRM